MKIFPVNGSIVVGQVVIHDSGHERRQSFRLQIAQPIEEVSFNLASYEASN